MRLRASFRTLSLSLVTAVAILGCSAEPLGVAAPEEPTPSALLGLPVGEVLGGTLATVDRLLKAVLNILVCPLEGSVTRSASIGPAGGTLKVGRHTLVVPRGALSRTVTITGRTSGDRTASVLFQPQGLQFAVPAHVRLDYGPCANIPNPKKVLYVSDDGKTFLSVLRSIDDPRAEVVDGEIDHFSRYAVAW